MLLSCFIGFCNPPLHEKYFRASGPNQNRVFIRYSVPLQAVLCLLYLSAILARLALSVFVKKSKNGYLE